MTGHRRKMVDKGGSAAGVARASADQYFISASATSPTATHLHPFSIPRSTPFPFPPFVFCRASLATSCNCSRLASSRRRPLRPVCHVFLCFPAFTLSLSLPPRPPPSTLISLFATSLDDSSRSGRTLLSDTQRDVILGRLRLSESIERSSCELHICSSEMTSNRSQGGNIA